MIRVESSVVSIPWHGQTYGMSISMILAIFVFIGGVVMWNVLPSRPAELPIMAKYRDADTITPK